MTLIVPVDFKFKKIVVTICDPYFSTNFSFFFGARPQLSTILVITKKDNVGSFETHQNKTKQVKK